MLGEILGELELGHHAAIERLNDGHHREHQLAARCRELPQRPEDWARSAAVGRSCTVCMGTMIGNNRHARARCGRAAHIGGDGADGGARLRRTHLELIQERWLEIERGHVVAGECEGDGGATGARAHIENRPDGRIGQREPERLIGLVGGALGIVVADCLLGG